MVQAGGQAGNMATARMKIETEIFGGKKFRRNKKSFRAPFMEFLTEAEWIQSAKINIFIKCFFVLSTCSHFNQL